MVERDLQIRFLGGERKHFLRRSRLLRSHKEKTDADSSISMVLSVNSKVGKLDGKFSELSGKGMFPSSF